MKLHVRRRIFYVFLLLFVVISAVVVLYAEGWRLDPTTLNAEKAGGIYVRSFPYNAAITLDGKPIQNQSAFLSSGTFISGLFPKTYTLQLKMAGYDAWTETAQVIPSLVSEMKYAVLIPQNAINVATSGNVAEFFEVDGDVVTQNPSGTILWNGSTIGKGTIVSHSTNLKTAIVRSASTKANTSAYWFYDFQNRTSTNLNPILQQSGIALTPQLNLFIEPYNDTSVIAQTKTRLVAINSETHKTTAIETTPMGETLGSSVAISPSVMAWTRFNKAANTSQIVVYDKFSGNIIDSSLTVAGAVKQLGWIKNNSLGILEDNNSLYLYNVSGEQLSKLADDVKQFYPTSDGTAIAALEYHSLEIFSFSTSDYYRFNLPDIDGVQGLIWYKDMTHLFVVYPDKVSFLDLADTHLKNFTTVSQGTSPFYDEQNNSLYLIDQGQKLLRFDFPQ